MIEVVWLLQKAKKQFDLIGRIPLWTACKLMHMGINVGKLEDKWSMERRAKLDDITK